jgi:hypothetical protein
MMMRGNKAFVLSLGILAVSPAIYAEKIQFNNGDSLDVLLIKHTRATITFAHSSLGEMTVDKSKISNLQSLNLEVLEKEIKASEQGTLVAEVPKKPVTEDKVVAKATQAAQEKAILARESVDQAKSELLVAQENLKNAEIEDLDIAEQAVIEAESKVKSTEKALVSAVDDISAVAKNAEIAKRVSIANMDVVAAEDELKVAKERIKQARNNVRNAKKRLRYAEEANATDEVIDSAEKNLAIAEERVGIAEEQVKVAEGKLQVAQEHVQLAKGEKVPNGFLGTGWFKGWDSHFDVGITGASGATNNAKFRVGFGSLLENDAHRWDFKTYFLYTSEDGGVTEQRLNAILVKDWFFKDTPWFAFASATYDMDQFKNWDHRLQVAVGPGYQFIKNDDWELSGRMAGTGIFEFGTRSSIDGIDFDQEDASTFTQENKQSFELMLGADTFWQISPKQKFTLSNYIYPSMSNIGDFRNVTKINWMHDLEFFEGLAIKFTVNNEYDTTQAKRNDLRYSISAMVNF